MCVCGWPDTTVCSLLKAEFKCQQASATDLSLPNHPWKDLMYLGYIAGVHRERPQPHELMAYLVGWYGGCRSHPAQE